VDDVIKAITVITKEVAKGNLTVEEADQLARVLERCARILTAQDDRMSRPFRF
jgi:hypothetical protein